MSRKGPAPTQHNTLKLRGGLRGKYPKKKQATARQSMPSCPQWLPTEAKDEWKRIALELHNMGVLTKLDRGIMTAYCYSWSDFVNARKQAGEEYIIKLPGGQRMHNPVLKVANEAKMAMLKFAAELGLSPSARTRVAVVEKESESEVSRLLGAG